MVEISATENGAGALPGCTYRPGAALRAWHDQDGVGHALGNDAVYLGIGLAEQAHGIASGPHIAFGGLLV
jgi:hypothetical protein